MTAFASVQSTHTSSILHWEIKSVNHRYLDLTFNLPKVFRGLEAQLRAVAKSELARGKVDCQLYLNQPLQAPMVTINQPLALAMLAAGEHLATTCHVAHDLTLSQLLNWPGVVTVDDTGLSDNLTSIEVIDIFNQALTQLKHARAQEGLVLNGYLRLQAEKLQAQLLTAHTLVASTSHHVRDKFNQRLQLLSQPVDDMRFEQALALILAKLDVTEELDRLNCHLNEVLALLTLTQIPSGRKLDFLMQELHREAHTLSTKSDTTLLTQCAIEMKVIIEQMREQIQNIE